MIFIFSEQNRFHLLELFHCLTFQPYLTEADVLEGLYKAEEESRACAIEVW